MAPKCNELTKEEYKTMRPKNGKLAKAHGLPKIHKEYSSILKFRPIVDIRPNILLESSWRIYWMHYLWTNSRWKIHLMQLIKLKMYHLICLMMDATMYF